MIDVASRLYLQGGLSIVPIDPTTKRPKSAFLPQAVDPESGDLLFWNTIDGRLVANTQPSRSRKKTWKPYQENPPTIEELESWLNRGMQSVAVVCGKVSGGVEILDFDVDGYYSRWIDLVRELANKLPTQITGGGGMQVAWRCEEIDKNQKLAWEPDDDPDNKSGRIVAIETRGEGGYAVLPPSIHPSGNCYQLVLGKFSNIPTITPDERKTLLDAARSLCRAPKSKQEIAAEEKKRYKASIPQSVSHYDDDHEFVYTVVDWYNNNHDIEDILRAKGYTEGFGNRWSRPGEARSNGVEVLPHRNRTINYSSNDDLHHEKQIRGPYDYRVMLEYNGDWSAAFRATADEYRITAGAQRRAQFAKATERYFESRQEEQHAAPEPQNGLECSLSSESMQQAEFVLIALSQSDQEALSELGYPCVWHENGVKAWSNGTRSAISHIRDVFLVVGQEQTEEAYKIRSRIKRAKVVALPAGFETVSDFRNWTAYPERFINQSINLR